jgi:hypothetical protein
MRRSYGNTYKGFSSERQQWVTSSRTFCSGIMIIFPISKSSLECFPRCEPVSWKIGTSRSSGNCVALSTMMMASVQRSCMSGLDGIAPHHPYSSGTRFPLKGQVEQRNLECLNKLPGETVVYKAMDSRGSDIYDNRLSLSTAEQLLDRLVCPREVPLKVTRHGITLGALTDIPLHKVGAQVMLLRVCLFNYVAVLAVYICPHSEHVARSPCQWLVGKSHRIHHHSRCPRTTHRNSRNGATQGRPGTSYSKLTRQ